ncbi:MAG: hypothetical protein R3E39_08960 [Anaerolineae bacterium]
MKATKIKIWRSPFLSATTPQAGRPAPFRALGIFAPNSSFSLKALSALWRWTTPNWPPRP